MTTELLDVYLPMDRRQALARGTSLAERSTGVALLADLVGFTPLTEAIARVVGPVRGAEEVATLLNQVYGELIDAVDTFGGSVVCFSGDAITCWFDESAVSRPSSVAPVQLSDPSNNDPGQADTETGGQGDKQTAQSAIYNLQSAISQSNGPRTTDYGLRTAALRATACALAMQHALRAFAAIRLPSGGSAVLSVKVALAAGSVRRLLVGDPSIQRLEVLAGSLLDHLAALQHQARSGEVLLDTLLAHQLAEQLVFSWRETPDALPVATVTGLVQAVAPLPWPPLPTLLTDDVCHPWLLPVVYARLAQTPGPFQAELRPAVALMLEFHGLDYDADPQAAARLDDYIRWVQQIIMRYQGALIDLTMGDRGSYLYAVWGAPEAHDDDAARALAAARELLAPPPSLGWLRQLRAGLARGTLWSGSYGGPTRRTYGVLGDATNLAFRLMNHAPLGALWCEYAVARAAERRWTFAELPPVRVKGKASLIRVYEPTTPFERRDAPAASPLVGRETEQAQLAALLDAVVAGASQLVVLEGEAGIGKSRLVDELARLTRVRGLVGLLGLGQSIERHTPYRAWRDILRAFFDLDGLADVAAQRARVEATLATLRPDLLARLPLLNDLLHLDIPETPQTRLLDPAQRGESVNSLVIELLHSWAREQPLILVLEDAHWFDSRSWDVTVRVARALAAAQQPLLMLLTTRPVTIGGPEDAAFRTLLSLKGATHMRLGALSVDAILALAAARMGLQPDELAGEVVSLIQTRSGGNPFFAEELVDTLRQRALIQLDTGGAGGTSRYVASPALVHNQQLLPDTLQGLLLERIDRLPPDEQLTLKVAAVIGATFAYPPLHYARTRGTHTNDVALRQHLGTLVAHDFTVLAAGEPELAYRFKHILAQEAAYQTLLYAQRRMLHRTLAEWYEGGSSVVVEDGQPAPLDDRRSPLLPLLAHHYRHAEDAERERHYARLAGIQAADQYANDEALAYFSRALALTPEEDLAGRFDLLRERLDIHARQEQQAAMVDELERLEPLAEALNDDARRAYCAVRRAVHDARGGDYAGGIAAAQQAIALAQAAGETGIAVDAHRIWGIVLMNQGNLAVAQAQNELALHLARAQGDRFKEARSLNNIGVCLLYAFDYAAAEQYFQVCLDLCRETGDRVIESVALRNLGEIARGMGDYTAARDYKIKSLAVARAIGVTTAERAIPMDLGELAQMMGDYDAALAAYQESLRLINAVGDPDNECLVLYDMARLFWKWGQYPAARSYAQRAIDIARTIGNSVTEAAALIALGHIELALEQVEAARRIYQTAREECRAMGQSICVLEAEAGLARVALAGGDLPGALAQVHSILASLETVSLDGADEPFLIELTCYQVLEAGGDQRAPSVLQALYARFQQMLESISGEEEHRMFLENVPTHRDIVAAWRAAKK